MIIARFHIPDLSRPLAGEGSSFAPKYEMKEFLPTPIAPAEVIGRRIDGHSLHIGTYGMGGAGLYGLKLANEWLVIAVRGAGAWMRADGRLIEDLWWSDRGRPKPWVLEGEGDYLARRITGRAIASLDVQRDAMRLTLDDGLSLYIESDANTRPRFEGDGSPRAFGADDDLRSAVFLAPTHELWV